MIKSFTITVVAALLVVVLASVLAKMPIEFWSSLLFAVILAVVRTGLESITNQFIR